MSVTERRSAPRRPNHSFRTSTIPWAWAVLAVLLLQNVVGIYLNLFVALPTSPDLGTLIASYSALAMHVALGFLLLATTGIVVYLAARSRNVSLWVPAVATLAFSLLAFSSGVEFTIGGQDDLVSFVMEIAFLGAVASDVLVLYAASRFRVPQAPAAMSSLPAEE